MMFRTTVHACAALLMLGALSASSPAEAARAKRKTPPAAAKAEPKPAAKQTPEPPASTTRSSDSEEPGARRGPARIEFDDRLVQGQTNKANAIYLFERRESSMRSLLKKRINFHDEIDEMLEDELVR